MRNKGLHNECSDRSFTSTHLNLHTHTQKKKIAKTNIKQYSKIQPLCSITQLQRSFTSEPRRALTNSATSARSSFRATKPLFPRFPNSISGFTTSFVEESHASWLVNSVKSVASVTCKREKKTVSTSMFLVSYKHSNHQKQIR